MHLKMKLLTQAMKNPASSVTDLRALLTREKGLLSLLSEHEEIFSIAKYVLEEENFNISTIYNSDVLHPIDAYNLIKRLGRAWPKVLEALKLHADRDWPWQDVNNVYKLDMEDTVGKEDKGDKGDKEGNEDKNREGEGLVSRRLVRELGTALEQFPSWEEDWVCYETFEPKIYENIVSSIKGKLCSGTAKCPDLLWTSTKRPSIRRDQGSDIR